MSEIPSLEFVQWVERTNGRRSEDRTIGAPFALVYQRTFRISTITTLSRFFWNYWSPLTRQQPAYRIWKHFLGIFPDPGSPAMKTPKSKSKGRLIRRSTSHSITSLVLFILPLLSNPILALRVDGELHLQLIVIATGLDERIWRHDSRSQNMNSLLSASFSPFYCALKFTANCSASSRSSSIEEALLEVKSTFAHASIGITNHSWINSIIFFLIDYVFLHLLKWKWMQGKGWARSDA